MTERKIDELPAGWSAQVIDDGHGRELIRGTGPDGQDVRGYGTIYGQWIAYFKDEIGWTNRDPQRTPAAAIVDAIRTAQNK